MKKFAMSVAFAACVLLAAAYAEEAKKMDAPKADTVNNEAIKTEAAKGEAVKVEVPKCEGAVCEAATPGCVLMTGKVSVSKASETAKEEVKLVVSEEMSLAVTGAKTADVAKFDGKDVTVSGKLSGKGDSIEVAGVAEKKVEAKAGAKSDSATPAKADGKKAEAPKDDAKPGEKK